MTCGLEELETWEIHPEPGHLHPHSEPHLLPDKTPQHPPFPLALAMLCYEVQTFATESHSLIVSASPATLSHIFPADGVSPTAALLLPRLLNHSHKILSHPFAPSLPIHSLPQFCRPFPEHGAHTFYWHHNTLPTSLPPCYPLTSVDKKSPVPPTQHVPWYLFDPVLMPPVVWGIPPFPSKSQYFRSLFTDITLEQTARMLFSTRPNSSLSNLTDHVFKIQSSCSMYQSFLFHD